MLIDRKYMNDLNSLMRDNSLNVKTVEMEKFLGKTLYFNRLKRANGFDTIDDMVNHLRPLKPIQHGRKYIEFI
jgi:hypothetical protein